MAHEVSDCKYDAVKIYYKFAKLLHFIEHHAEKDAKSAGDTEFHKLLDEIEEHLEKFVERLDKHICK